MQPCYACRLARVLTQLTCEYCNAVFAASRTSSLEDALGEILGCLDNDDCFPVDAEQLWSGTSATSALEGSARAGVQDSAVVHTTAPDAPVHPISTTGVLDLRNVTGPAAASCVSRQCATLHMPAHELSRMVCFLQEVGAAVGRTSDGQSADCHAQHLLASCQGMLSSSQSHTLQVALTSIAISQAPNLPYRSAGST
jgi:hypothetical protein